MKPNPSSCGRRTFLKTSAALAAAGAWRLPIIAVAAEPEAVDIGDENQLFLDDWIVAEIKGLKRVLHQPVKQGLIKEADGSDWERGDVYPPAGHVVCRDKSGRFHMTCRYMWWDPRVTDENPSIGDDKAHWFRQTIGYATSDDGIHWRRPTLGLIEGPTGFKKIDEFPFEAPTGMSKQNSLGCPIDFIHDLDAHGNLHDPEKRFLLRTVKFDGTNPFARITEKQMYFAADWPDFAGDPEWKDKLTPVPGGDISPRGFKSLAGYDHQAGLWFAVSQDSISNWLPRKGRDIARWTSPDLARWDDGSLALPVAEDESRTPTDWIEYMNLDAYRVGGPQSGVWLGQVQIFHSDRRNPQYQWPLGDGVWRKGTTELRLVLSRDAGRSWQRVGGKQVWLPHSPEPHGFDRLVFGTYPLRVGDELWLYHMVYDGDHLIFNRDGSLFEPGFIRKGRTALATQRWDGYVSLDAGSDTASLLTRPLVFKGDQLLVNLDARRGELKVELLDELGAPLAGFSQADCLPLRGDGVALRVHWRGEAELALAAGKPVRVRFALRDGSLYGFRLA